MNSSSTTRRAFLKRTALVSTASCLASWTEGFCAAETSAPAGFEDRRRMFLDAVWADYQAQRDKLSAKQAFWRAEALFELGKVDAGRRLVHRGLDQLVPGNRENRWIHGGNSGFIAWPGLDCYVRYGDFLDEALRERYRQLYTGAVFYRRLSTSNHKIMAAVARYLATEIWGADAFNPDPFFQGRENEGSRFEKNDPTGERYVRSIIVATAESGPGEYASRPYGAENVLPLLTLAECARDPDIRRRAALAYEYALVQLAPVYLGGHLATFSPRSYPDMLTQQPWGIAALTWAYFGGAMPASLHGEWALRAATARYRLPREIETAGTDRTQAYVHRALINRWALCHFVNRSYVLFSRSPKASAGQFQGQSYPCGVMWDEPDPNKGSHLWLTNPAADGDVEGNNTNGLHTHGTTPHEQQVQRRDALLTVYNIPAGFRNPYVLVFVPGGWREAINESGAAARLFLHYGSVLVALAAAHPFEWNPQSGIRAPAGRAHEGDSEFRIAALQTAVALETALPSQFAGLSPREQLESFRRSVLAKARLELKASGEKPAAYYADRAGNLLECAFDGPDRINGQLVDYPGWPALDNPWMHQPQGGNLVLTCGGSTRFYDFQKWLVTEERR